MQKHKIYNYKFSVGDKVYHFINDTIYVVQATMKQKYYVGQFIKIKYYAPYNYLSAEIISEKYI